MKPLAFVLDTNLLFNLEADSGLGKNPKEIMLALYEYALKVGPEGLHFYMPPAIVDEIATFVPEGDDAFKKILSVVSVKSPDISQINFSAQVFYTLVDEIRNRSYRGLNVAEEELHNASRAVMGRELHTIEYQKEIGQHVTKLRDRYRNATRVKFLDSVADLDVIVLAKEVDGSVVTSDEGIMIWARLFGVKETKPQFLKEQLETLLHQASTK